MCGTLGWKAKKRWCNFTKRGQKISAELGDRRISSYRVGHCCSHLLRKTHPASLSLSGSLSPGYLLSTILMNQQRERRMGQLKAPLALVHIRQIATCSFWGYAVVSRTFIPDLQPSIKASAKITPFHQSVCCLTHAFEESILRFPHTATSTWPSFTPVSVYFIAKEGTVRPQELELPYEETDQHSFF